jgi:hypothetical protein
MAWVQPEWTEQSGSPDAASRYVNGTDIAFTQWDMTLDFQLAVGEKSATAGEMRFVAQRVARIVMSPTHAKVLAEMIRNAVSQWEERFGTLPDTNALMTPGPGVAPEGETGDPQ